MNEATRGTEEIAIVVTEPELPVVSVVLQEALPAGALLRVVASGPTMLQRMRVDGLSAEGTAEEFAVEHRFARRDMELRWDWYITTMSMAVFRVPRPLAAGERLNLRLSYSGPDASCDTRPIGSASAYSGLTWTLAFRRVDTWDAPEGTNVAAPCDLDFVSGPSERIEAFLKPDGRVLVRAFDAGGNPAPVDDPVETDSPDGERVTGRDAMGREALSHAVPCTMDDTPIYFGEFHWHTEFSGDGQRSLDDAMRSARDELALDFAGPADHLNIRTADYWRGLTPRDQARICRTFDEPGMFCSIPSAELSGRYGHTNICADSFDTLLETMEKLRGPFAEAMARKQDRYPLRELLDVCEGGRALVVPHHTNMDSFVREGVVRDDGRPYWCAMHWPIPADRSVVRLAEIVQGRGCFEAEDPDAAWHIDVGGFGGSIRTALARGYRLGFTGGTDNHCGWPTRHGASVVGLTAVQCATLDTESVFRALHARRCYATSGARIVADATLNGQPMGSELQLEPGAPRLFRISIRGMAPLAAVQVIHAGCVLQDLPVKPDTLDFVTEWADERPGRALQDAYYYIRARQTDGHCCWLSPFWVDLPE